MIVVLLRDHDQIRFFLDAETQRRRGRAISALVPHDSVLEADNVVVDEQAQSVISELELLHTPRLVNQRLG